MTEPFTWVAVLLGGGGGSIIAFLTFWMNFSKTIADANNSADAAEERAKNAERLAAGAIAKHEMFVENAQNYRVLMAEKLSSLEARLAANTASLTQAEDRFAKAIEDITQKIDSLNSNVMRTLGELVKKPQ